MYTRIKKTTFQYWLISVTEIKMYVLKVFIISIELMITTSAMVVHTYIGKCDFLHSIYKSAKYIYDVKYHVNRYMLTTYIGISTSTILVYTSC